MYISPMRDAIDAGLRPTNHTDFVVAPLDQMTMLWSSVNRISRAGAQIGSDQRVTPYEGLKCMTQWAAEQYDEQAMKGTLEVGKLADLVILERDPLKVAPMDIKDINLPTASSKYAGMSYRWRAHVCDMAEVNQATGKVWTLVSLESNSVHQDNPPTMKFEGGRLSIFGGVNRLSGTYALIDNQSVTLGELVSTQMAGPPERMELERSFSQIMATVDGFHVDGRQLDLLSGGRVVATFQSQD